MFGARELPRAVTSELSLEVSIGVCQMSQGIQGRANHLFKGEEVKATRCVVWELQPCWSLKHTGPRSWEIEREMEMKQDPENRVNL